MEKEEVKKKKKVKKVKKEENVVVESNNNSKKILSYILKVGSILLILLPIYFILSYLFYEGNFIITEDVVYTLKEFCNETFRTTKFPLLEAPYVYGISLITIILVSASFFINKLEGVVKFVLGTFVFLGVIANLLMFSMESSLFSITIGFIISFLTYLVLIQYVKNIPLKEKSIITGVILLISFFGGVIYNKVVNTVLIKPLIYIEDNKLIYLKELNSKKVVLTDKALSDEDESYYYNYIKLSDDYKKLYYLSEIKLDEDDELIGNLNFYSNGKSKEISSKVEDFYISNTGKLVIYSKNDKLYYWNGKEPVKVTESFKDAEIISDSKFAFINDENKAYIYDISKDEKELLAKEVRDVVKTSVNTFYITGEDEDLSIYTLDKEKVDDSILEFYLSDNNLFYLKENNDKQNLYVYNNNEISLVDRNIEDLVSSDGTLSKVVYLKDKAYYVYSKDVNEIAYLGSEEEVEDISLSYSGKYLYFLKNYHDSETEDEITRELVRYTINNGNLLNRTRFSYEAFDYYMSEDKCFYFTDYDEEDYSASLYECASGKLLTTDATINALMHDDYILYLTDYDEDDYTFSTYLYANEDKILMASGNLLGYYTSDQYVATIEAEEYDDTEGNLKIYNLKTKEKKTISEEASFVYGPYEEVEFITSAYLNSLEESEEESGSISDLHKISYDKFLELYYDGANEVIMFGHGGCSWCLEQAKVYSELQDDYDYYVYYVDVTTLTSNEIFELIDLTGYDNATPYSVIIDKERIVDTQSGYRDYTETKDFLTSVHG